MRFSVLGPRGSRCSVHEVLGARFTRFSVLGARFSIPEQGTKNRERKTVNREPGTENGEPGTENGERQNGIRIPRCSANGGCVGPRLPDLRPPSATSAYSTASVTPF